MLNNGCFDLMLRCLNPNQFHTTGDPVSRQRDGQMATNIFQFAGNSCCLNQIKMISAIPSTEQHQSFENINGQQHNCIQHQSRCRSSAFKKVNRQNIRRIRDPTSESVSSTYFRLRNLSRNLRGSTILTANARFNRLIRQQEKSEMSKIRWYQTRRLGRESRWTRNILARRTPLSSSSNSNNSCSVIKSQIVESLSPNSYTLLAIPIMVADTNSNDMQIDNSRQELRNSSPRRQDVKTKTTSPSRLDDNLRDRGDRGERLFKRILKQRQFTDAAIEQVIQSWFEAWQRHRQQIGQFEEFWTREGNKWTDLMQVLDPEAVISNFVAQLKADEATNLNINSCKIAIGTLFNMQGFSEEKVNGQALKQTMKQPSSAMRKEHKEEPIYKLDILLKHLQSKAQRLDQLPEMEFMGCVISSIMAFATLRLAEVHRATATPLPDGAWQLHTIIRKTKVPKTTITFRPLCNRDICPMFWKKEATYEQLYKAVNIIMQDAGIEKSNTVISIRKSSITKDIDQRATQQQINRFSMHADGAATVQFHYDMNLNDDIRERLAVFE
ncbi:MAG: hypothetical protein EZS28_034016 [Streblomastix strix]|uniref:Tyr recombinase domain-containing protein n=1 Tax=Streblomastix strix TaxID=222440 RepID=A0A5J4UIH8_9EUKA|nr:MAG: hypothetical protein EZS28_034016 [Streblomastix strix]